LPECWEIFIPGQLSVCPSREIDQEDGVFHLTSFTPVEIQEIGGRDRDTKFVGMKEEHD
jgi:hypothetical protein